MTEPSVPSSSGADSPSGSAPKPPKAPVERRVGDDRSGLMWRAIVLRVVQTGLQLTGAKIRTFGAPPEPGCVVAFHHNAPVDALALGLQGRRLRGHHPIAMVHADIFRAPVIGHIVTRAGMVPVEREVRADRADAFAHSVDQLGAGHTMFIAPESGISRSLTVQNVRHGATRLALKASVPLVPVVTFGLHRYGGSHGQSFRPKRGIPVDIHWGAPIDVTDVEDTTARLKQRLDEMLAHALEIYPEPGPGQWWWPQHLGGTAPTTEEAAEARRKRFGQDGGVS